MCHSNLSNGLLRAGRLDQARAECEIAAALAEPLVRDNPQSTDFRHLLAYTYLLTGQVQLGKGDPAGASAAWRRAVALYKGIESPDSEVTFVRACCHACLAGLADRPGSGVSSGEGGEESDRAMSWLRQSVALGMLAPYIYRNEQALDPLRTRLDFRLLMMDLAFPTEPFAGSE